MNALRYAATAVAAATLLAASGAAAQAPPGASGNPPVDPETVGPPLPVVRTAAPAAKPAVAPPAAPVVPVFADAFNGLSSAAPLDVAWAVPTTGGNPWSLDEARGELRANASGPADATLAARKRFNTTQGFTVAVNLRLPPSDSADTAACGLVIGAPTPPPGVPAPAGAPKVSVALVRNADGTAAVEVAPARAPLPKEFYTDQLHQMVVAYRPAGGKLEVRIDGATRYQASGVTLPQVAQVSLLVRRGDAAFDGIAVAETDTAPSLLPPPVAAAVEAVAGAQRAGWRVNGETIEQSRLGATPQTYEMDGEASTAPSGSAGVLARGWATGNALASPRYGLRVRIAGKESGTGYVDALIDPVARTLTTRAVVDGREALAPQSTPLPPTFDFTEEHRIRVAWDDAGKAWSFSVDNDPKSAQQRALDAAALPGDPGSRRFVPVLVTEDTRAAYWGLSVSGTSAAASAAESPEQAPPAPEPKQPQKPTPAKPKKQPAKPKSA
jgi:hypothetical protein